LKDIIDTRFSIYTKKMFIACEPKCVFKEYKAEIKTFKTQ